MILQILKKSCDWIQNISVDYVFQDIKDIPGTLPEGRTKPWRNLFNRLDTGINDKDLKEISNFYSLFCRLKDGLGESIEWNDNVNIFNIRHTQLLWMS